MNPEDIAKEMGPGEDQQFIGNIIVLHVYGDDTYADALPRQPGISLRNNFSVINLPNGDTIYLAKTIDDLKNNIKLGEKEMEALFNAGLVDSDDES
jgi:hypothetical protein